MLPIKLFFLLVFVASLGFNCAQDIEPNENNSDNSQFARIFKGKDAEVGQFPWFVQIRVILWERKLPSGAVRRRMVFCGGSLITYRHVLTAAHCLSFTPPPLRTEVICGFNSIYNVTGQQMSTASRLESHPEYDPWTLDNDIGIITLATPVNILNSTYVRPVLLSIFDPQPNTLVQIAGTGITSDSSRFLSPTLKYANLTTISNKECERTFGPINKAQMCADDKANKAAACSGDSGSALVKSFFGLPVQIGLLSAGAYTCEQGYPNIFTRIYPYFWWIQKILWRLDPKNLRRDEHQIVDDRPTEVVSRKTKPFIEIYSQE